MEDGWMDGILLWDGTAVGDRAQQFWFEQEVAEACAVDAYVGALLGVFSSVLRAVGPGGWASLGGGGLGLERLLVLLVVDQVLVVVGGHLCAAVGCWGTGRGVVVRSGDGRRNETTLGAKNRSAKAAREISLIMSTKPRPQPRELATL
jgi:hypothetical protein